MPEVNPVHFKPMWAIVRLGDDPDFADNPLVQYSDADMIALRLGLTMLLKLGPPDENDAEGKQWARIRQRLQAILDCLIEALNMELEEEANA